MGEVRFTIDVIGFPVNLIGSFGPGIIVMEQLPLLLGVR